MPPRIRSKKISLPRRVYWWARERVLNVANQREGLRVFALNSSLAPLAPETAVRVQRTLCSEAALLPFTLPRSLKIGLQGVPPQSELFYVEADRVLASWGILAPSVTSWALTEIGARVTGSQTFAALVSFETIESQRGQGLYPRLLNAMHARMNELSPDSPLLIWCKRTNAASTRGILKAGFRELAVVRRPIPYGPLSVESGEPMLLNNFGLSFIAK